jgi:protein TonB
MNPVSEGRPPHRPGANLFRAVASVVPAFLLTLAILLVLSNLRITEDNRPNDIVEDLRAVTAPPPPPPPPSDTAAVQPVAPVQIPLDLSVGEAGVPTTISISPVLVDAGRPASKPRMELPLETIRAATHAADSPNHVYQLSEVSRPPEMIYRAMPDMSMSALKKTPGCEGRAVILFIVEIDGTARNVRIVQTSGSPEVDDAWVDAIRRSRFRPAMRDGKPVRCWARMPTLRILLQENLFSA